MNNKVKAPIEWIKILQFVGSLKYSQFWYIERHPESAIVAGYFDESYFKIVPCKNDNFRRFVSEMFISRNNI